MLKLRYIQDKTDPDPVELHRFARSIKCLPINEWPMISQPDSGVLLRRCDSRDITAIESQQASS